MKFSAALFILVFSLVCAGESIEKVGLVNYSLPKGWTQKSAQVDDILPTVTLQNGTDRLLMTYMPGIRASFDSQKKLDDFLRLSTKKIAAETVEGKAIAKHLKTPKIICSYANFTDKGLVGKPVVPDNWKFTTMGFAKMGNGLVHFTYFTNKKANLINNPSLKIIETLSVALPDKKKLVPFSYSFTEQNVEIIIPEIPMIKLVVHPLSETYPQLRYMGSNPSYNLSIITPSIDSGMTSQEFAQSMSKSLINRYQLSKDQYTLSKQRGSDSFSIFYFIKIKENMFQLNAHLFAVSPLGKHGVDVHISKIEMKKENVKSWLNGFPKAKIKKISDNK